MKLLPVVPLLAVLAFVSGCAETFREELSKSDITVEQLEGRMRQAMDPTGRFAGAKTYVMRQQITTEQGWMDPPLIQMVEIKFRRPDQFKLTTYTDNDPETAIIANGKSGWMVDLKNKKSAPLDGVALRRVLGMVRLTDPGNRFEDVFPKVDIDRSIVDGEPFYRLTCRGEDGVPVYIYVGAKDNLNRRVRMKISVNGTLLDYDSQMLAYSMYEGVMIPDESVVRQGGTGQKTKVVYYKLDVPLEDSEFRPPLF
jgi:outer membrane lipoprotein-sorting protein